MLEKAAVLVYNAACLSGTLMVFFIFVFFLFSNFEQLQILLYLYSIHLLLLVRYTHTLVHTEAGVKHWAFLLYCTTHVLHHITPWAFQKKGKSNSSFLAKAQSFSLRQKAKTQESKVQIVNTTVAFLQHEWNKSYALTRAHECRKTNRTFAKNILVFVPLPNTWHTSTSNR